MTREALCQIVCLWLAGVERAIFEVSVIRSQIMITRSNAMGSGLVRRLCSCLALVALGFALLMPLPAMALPAMAPSAIAMPLSAKAMIVDHRYIPIALATMDNKADAKAKEVEGKLESAYGELTGDTGHQIKGKAKQVQASAMNAAENLKKGTKSVAQKIGDAATGKAKDHG
jgi:uncharacterized protein YjbJ (UPF0337 family)